MAACTAARWPGLTGSAKAAGGPLAALARELDGDVVTRSSPRYPSARLVYDTRFDGVRPLAIAYPVSVADVQRVVRWSKKHGIRIVARSGGHSYGGYSTVSNGVVVDLSRLAGVRALPNGTARIGGGAVLIDVYTRLADQSGVSIPGGSCPTVGIGGLALGGGLGFWSRKYGTTSDTIRQLVVVTADGKARTCNQSENANLYWACRGGGGGNFGIATSFVLQTHPATDVTTFRIQWPWENARDVLTRWQEWAPDAPDEIFSVCNVAGGSGQPPRIAASGQYLGSEAELRSLLAPLVNTGAPTSVSVVPRSFQAAVFYWAACGSTVEQCLNVPRATFKAKSAYALAPIPGEGIDAILSAVEARSATPSFGAGGVILDSYGGAINRVPKGATAFVHRNARCSLQFYAYWQQGDPPEVAGANLRWISGFYRTVRPYVSRFAYQNYIDPSLPGWRTAYYGSNLPRLVSVKRAVDPGNLFRFRQSIPTRL